MPIVDSSKSSLEDPAARFEIIRDRDSGGGPQLPRRVLAAFAESFKQDISTQGDSGHNERCRRSGCQAAFHDEREIGRFAGMVESRSDVQLGTATTKLEDRRIPFTLICQRQKPTDVVRSNRPLEAV